MVLETQKLTHDHHSLNTLCYGMEVSGKFQASAALPPWEVAPDIYYTASWFGVIASKKRSVPTHPALVIFMP